MSCAMYYAVAIITRGIPLDNAIEIIPPLMLLQYDGSRASQYLAPSAKPPNGTPLDMSWLPTFVVAINISWPFANKPNESSAQYHLGYAKVHGAVVLRTARADFRNWYKSFDVS